MGRAPLPAGCGLDLWYRRQRPARLGRGVRVLLPGTQFTPTADIARFRAQPVADDTLHAVSVCWPLRERGLRSADVETARTHGGLHRDAARRCVLGSTTRGRV